MSPELYILVISDAKTLSIDDEIERQGMWVRSSRVGSGDELAAVLDDQVWDAVLLDYDLPGGLFDEILSKLLQRVFELPVIVLADRIDDGRAIELLHSGVCDMVFKDRLFRLPGAIGNCVRKAERRGHRDVVLHRQSTQLSTMVEQVPVAIAMFDREMNYLAASRRWIEEYGSGAQELTGRNYYEVHPDTAAQWRQLHQQALAGAEVGNKEARWPDVNGRERWLRWEAHPWFDDADVIGGIIISAEDITEKKLAEQALRQSEEKFAAVFLHSPVGIGILRLADERFIDVNPAYLAIFGYGYRQVVGHTPIELGMWGDADQRHGILETFRATGEVNNQLTRLRRRNGETGEMLLSLIRLRLAEQECALGVVVDISDRVRMEQTLRERDEAFRAAIETAVDGFVAVDRDGRIVETNAAYLRRSGYGREELLGMHVAQVDVLQQPQDVAAELDKLAREGHDLFESRHRAKDGTVWPVEVNVTYRDVAGGRCFAFIRDISGRKRQEEMSRTQRSEMEFLVKRQVAAQTAAAFAHELNQPLEAISAYGYAALRMLYGGSGDSDKLLHAIEGSVKQAERAGKTLHELLNFLHHGEPVAEPMDINTLVTEAITIATVEGCSGFQQLVELEPALPPVLGNRIQLQKVLVNLICNGVEAMREAGVPDAAITIMVKTAAGRKMAQVTVRDNGPGLDEATLARIFTPFFTTKKRGIGLGLAISRSLVEANGGQLWVEPEAGPGATFHFTVPFAP